MSGTDQGLYRDSPPERGKEPPGFGIAVSANDVIHIDHVYNRRGDVQFVLAVCATGHAISRLGRSNKWAGLAGEQDRCLRLRRDEAFEMKPCEEVSATAGKHS